MADEEKGRIVGHGPCPNCDHVISYKVNKKGNLYAYCVTETMGGCNSGTTSRSLTGNRQLARRVTEWKSAEDRKRFLGETTPEKPKEPAKTSWLDREIF
jgi:hypothetical protein